MLGKQREAGATAVFLAFAFFFAVVVVVVVVVLRCLMKRLNDCWCWIESSPPAASLKRHTQKEYNKKRGTKQNQIDGLFFIRSFDRSGDAFFVSKKKKNIQDDAEYLVDKKETNKRIGWK